MLSALATLCFGCRTDLISANLQAPSTPRGSEMAQPVGPTQSVLIAGPYDLNPGLHRPITQPRLKQQSGRTHPQPQVRPAGPTVAPPTQPEKEPQGGADLLPEAQPNSPARRRKSPPQPLPTPVPSNSPLLIISPTARPSGPPPRRTQPSATPTSPSQRPDMSQGGTVTPVEGTPTDSPAARPSGPRPPLRLVPTAPESPILTGTPTIGPDSAHQSSAPTGNPTRRDEPRFRSLPPPAHPQNSSPASQPIRVNNDPTPAQTPTQPPALPTDMPMQQPQFDPPQNLPTDTAPIGAADDPQVSFIVLENSTTDFKLDFDEFGKENLNIEEIVSFRLRNDDLVTFTTGMNIYKQNDLEPVKNIPLILGWETELGDISFTVAAGAETFNRLGPQPTFQVGAKTSLFGKVLISGEVEHGPYKFNTTTLENNISYWRIRPSVYWQIDSKTSFFGLFQAGFFNDGNQEIQSFSRLERTIGPFSVAANVFTWNFAEDLEAESGYFSPRSFLLYNAEVGWKGKLFDPLTCHFAASIGNQVVNGDKSTSRGLQAKCTAALADNVELDFGYVLTNVISSGAGASNSHIFSGQLRIDF